MNKRFWAPLLLAVFLSSSMAGFCFDDQVPGFTPQWSVGDRWILEASYRDMNAEQEVWLQPIQWVFRVRAIKEVDNQQCYVVHVYPRNPEIKVQAVLWLSTYDLRPVRVIDIFPGRQGATSSERDIDASNPHPLMSTGSLIPYDLPVFPLVKTSVQSADGFDAYRAPDAIKFSSVSRIGGLGFRKTVGQTSKAPEKQYSDIFDSYKFGGESFQVELSEGNSENTLTQIWQEGAPWAISSESPLRRVKLIPITGQPTGQQGGQ